ncbi:hypothetical protein BKA59DRAFT_448941 [Fusarium tricinctum]|uniref:Uncharacterized protein n=1 Tax=Fusarium tricinctum TaxID=61284 RepID=A0A8K0S9M6_9HYPO|nr:hypothetical protein BKA59DRAFT_448941 [Fusarium tricinctum]
MDQPTPTQMIKHHWPAEVISRFPRAIALIAAQFEPNIDGIADERRQAWTRTKISQVVTQYKRLRTGPAPDTCKSYTYKFLTENADTWIPKSYSITDHPFTPQMRGFKTASFPKWLVISALWPESRVTASLALRMSVWWGVTFPPTGLFYLPASHCSVEGYERLFEGGQMEKVQRKNDLFITCTQQKPELEVEPGTTTVEKANDSSSSKLAPQNETTGHLSMASDLIPAASEPINKDPASLNEPNSSNSAVDAETMNLSENRNSLELPTVVYYEQRVKDLEKKLEKAKSDQQHA